MVHLIKSFCRILGFAFVAALSTCKATAAIESNSCLGVHVFDRLKTYGTIFRVLSLVFTISLLGLLSIPLYAGLLLLLVVAGALRASNVYKEQLGSYLKEENIGLFTLALGSIVTTTGRVRDSCSFCIYRLLYR